MRRINLRAVRQAVSGITDVAGGACIVGAALSWNTTIGCFLLGVALLIAGWVIDR